MANPKTGGDDQGGSSRSRGSAVSVYPDALKEAGQKAAELAQNPVARSMLAAASSPQRPR